MSELNIYELVEHLSFHEAAKLIAAHQQVREMAEEPDTLPSPPPYFDTLPVPTSPTIPARKQ